MTETTKFLINEYKKEFGTYYNYMKENDWLHDVFLNNSGRLTSGVFDTHNHMVSTIIDSLKKFVEEADEDINTKPVRNFLEFCNEIISYFIKSIDEYIDKNPLDSNSGEEDFIFRSSLFKLKTKYKADITKLDLVEGANRKSINIFNSDIKAPLLMREILCEKVPIVKEKTNNLGIDFTAEVICERNHNKIFINIPENEIPVWDATKHFFEQDEYTIRFWEQEIRKCRDGINIGSYHMSGWLYYHINHFRLNYGEKDDKGYKPPKLRDNEYYIDEIYKIAIEHGRQGVLTYGTRRFSKSVGMASRMSLSALLVNDAKISVQGFSEKPDLESLFNYIEENFSNAPPALYVPMMSSTIRDGIKLGLKGKKAQDVYPCGDIMFLNLEAGNTKKGTQKTAGGTPDFSLYDEALRQNENVLTPNGFVEIKDVKKGDVIYGADGKKTKIIDKIDVGVKQLYRLILKNGDTIECCGDHLWSVKDKTLQNNVTLNTLTLFENQTFSNGKSRYSLPLIKPIEFDEKKLSIDPYLFGLWIGDGKKDAFRITTVDEEIINYLEKFASDNNYIIRKCLKRDSHRKRDTYDIWFKDVKNKIIIFNETLKSYGIFNDKRLPFDFLFNSVENRIQLLSGIVDTDGYVNKNSYVEITQVKKDLFNDIVQLIKSLGICAKISERIVNGKIYYKVSFNTSILKCKIHRKQNNMKESESKKGNHNGNYVSVVKVEKIDSDQAYCIKVDNDDKLFVTTNFIVTHNCGKGDVTKPWNAALPSFEGGANGKWRCYPPLLAGTAGESQLSEQTERILKDPETYSVMPMQWDILNSMVEPEYRTWNEVTFATFVPAQMSVGRVDKISKKLSEFLKIEIEPELDIEILVTNWKASKEWHENKRNQLSKDLSLLASEICSYPLTPEDCYVTAEVNKFPGLEAKQRKTYVEQHGIGGQKVRLSRTPEGTIMANQTADPIIEVYPFKGTNMDAPIVMLDDPYSNGNVEPPLGLYCMGFDDVKHNKTDGDSVMSATVFKRSYEGGEWANRIVAFYDSRPDRKETYYKQLYLLMKYYNCRVLYENDDSGFLEWMERNYMSDIQKHFSNGIGLASEDNLFRNKNRSYGWSASADNIYRLEERIVAYTRQENVIVGDTEGLGGVDLINHSMLLEELYKYKKGKNADRIRSFGLALTLAQYYDKTYQYIKVRNSKFKSDDQSYKRKEVYSTKNGLPVINTGLTRW